MHRFSNATEAAIHLEDNRDSIDLGLLPAEGSWQPQRVEPCFTLGSGRAARAVLVKATDQSGEPRFCVEKVFRPGLLTRFIYRCAYQAPFAYQNSADAILACYYRRRVAAALFRAFVPEARVAGPLYARWDAASSAYVLGSELIRGRGIRPGAANSRMLRDMLPWSSASNQERPAEEIDDLLQLMSRLESLLRESGLVGTGWQVCKSAIVSTANLLRTETGYVVVDLESGIPALLVWRYIASGLRLRSLPLFDDLDANALRAFVEKHQPRFRTILGDEENRQLLSDVEQLDRHNRNWKQAELALGRDGLPFCSRRFQQAYRERCHDIWRARGLTDQETDRRFRDHPRLWTRLSYWCGCIPGPVGRFLQKISGNREFRSRIRELVTSGQARRRAAAEFCERKSIAFANDGRIAEGRRFTSLGLRFQANWLMSKLLPAGAQRWFSDGRHRRNLLIRLLLLTVSGRFQREYGQLQIRSAVDQWKQSGRLHPGEYELLQQACQAQDLDEYVRCFGMHLSIKLATPLLVPLKVGGLAGFLATGSFLYLLPLLVNPIFRTAITLSRMVTNARSRTAYGEALLVGALPVVGNLAFPVQMFASHPELSTFLIRDAAARLSRCVPIYGGRDSRLEMAAIQVANVPVELLEIGIGLTTGRIRNWFFGKRENGPPEKPEVLSISRWDRLAHEQLQLLQATEAGRRSLAERMDAAMFTDRITKAA